MHQPFGTSNNLHGFIYLFCCRKREELLNSPTGFFVPLFQDSFVSSHFSVFTEDKKILFVAFFFCQKSFSLFRKES